MFVFLIDFLLCFFCKTNVVFYKESCMKPILYSLNLETYGEDSVHTYVSNNGGVGCLWLAHLTLFFFVVTLVVSHQVLRSMRLHSINIINLTTAVSMLAVSVFIYFIFYVFDFFFDVFWFFIFILFCSNY